MNVTSFSLQKPAKSRAGSVLAAIGKGNTEVVDATPAAPEQAAAAAAAAAAATTATAAASS